MNVVRIIVGALVGYVISLATSFAWFALTRHEPTEPASTGYVVSTIVAGTILSLVCGYVAAYLANSWKGAAGVAILILGFSLWSLFQAHADHDGGLLWSLMISIFAMAPASYLGSFLVHD